MSDSEDESEAPIEESDNDVSVEEQDEEESQPPESSEESPPAVPRKRKIPPQALDPYEYVRMRALDYEHTESEKRKRRKHKKHKHHRHNDREESEKDSSQDEEDQQTKKATKRLPLKDDKITNFFEQLTKVQASDAVNAVTYISTASPPSPRKRKNDDSSAASTSARNKKKAVLAKKKQLPLPEETPSKCMYKKCRNTFIDPMLLQRADVKMVPCMDASVPGGIRMKKYYFCSSHCQMAFFEHAKQLCAQRSRIKALQVASPRNIASRF